MIFPRAIVAICFSTWWNVPHALAQDAPLIARAQRVPVAALDSGLPAVPFAQWLAALRRLPASGLHWEVNDCGEGGDGRAAPTCVEAILELGPDTTAHASLIMAGLDGSAGKPAVWMLYVAVRDSITDFKRLGDWAAYVRQPAPPPAPPGAWRGLIGAYASDHDTLYVYEDGGALVALVTPSAPTRLAQVSESVFAIAGRGVDHANVIFHRGEIQVGGVVRRRLQLGPADGDQLRLEPVRSVAELLVADRALTPPAESGAFLAPDLVELTALDSSLRLDIRYATTNNFLGSVFYSSAHAFLQRPAAEAIVRAARALRPLGYGILIHDAYRPWYVTKVFWDATPPASRWLVADPARGSRHNRGAAVDLTLYELATGAPVEMPSTYDEATPRARADFPGGTARQRWHRALLRRVLEAQDFTVNPSEWWHFDFRGWQRYQILNTPFEEHP